MRRAIALVLLLAATSTLLATTARAQGQPAMNGIGLVDYTRKPTFKVGDWVKYHMQGSSELGASDDYELTLVVAGEEDFWGDRAFWIETWVEGKTSPPLVQAALMSYDIFGDSSATERLMLYMRKAISVIDNDGKPRIDINKPAASILKTRREVKNTVAYTRDTLGVDTVQTPRGEFKGLKVIMKQGKGVTQAVGDSSVYTELRENRTSWYTPDVPITHVAREDIETTSATKSWLIGRSGEALKLNIRDRGTGSARLVDYGHNAQARLLPERFRHSIEEQVAAERASTRPAAERAGTPKRR